MKPRRLTLWVAALFVLILGSALVDRALGRTALDVLESLSLTLHVVFGAALTLFVLDENV